MKLSQQDSPTRETFSRESDTTFLREGDAAPAPASGDTLPDTAPNTTLLSGLTQKKTEAFSRLLSVIVGHDYKPTEEDLQTMQTASTQVLALSIGTPLVSILVMNRLMRNKSNLPTIARVGTAGVAGLAGLSLGNISADALLRSKLSHLHSEVGQVVREEQADRDKAADIAKRRAEYIRALGERGVFAPGQLPHSTNVGKDLLLSDERNPAPSGASSVLSAPSAPAVPTSESGPELPAYGTSKQSSLHGRDGASTSTSTTSPLDKGITYNELRNRVRNGGGGGSGGGDVSVPSFSTPASQESSDFQERKFTPTSHLHRRVTKYGDVMEEEEN